MSRENNIKVWNSFTKAQKQYYASALGCAVTTLAQGIRGTRNLGAKLCRQLEDLTNGRIKAKFIRPDVFGV